MAEAQSFRVVTDRQEFELRAHSIEALELCRSIRPAIFAADPGISDAPFARAEGVEPPAITRRRIALNASRPKLLEIMRHLDSVPAEIWQSRSDLKLVRDALRRVYKALEPFLDPLPHADVVSGAFTTLLDTLDNAEQAASDALGLEDWIYRPELLWLLENDEDPTKTNVDAAVLTGGDPEKQTVFTKLQAAILAALERRVLTKSKLAAAACGGDDRRLYRKGGIKELMDAGRVLNDRRIGGYYRPDAPPFHLIG